MPEIEPEKLHAARAAVALIESGMIVGLGSGSTASVFVRLLGERVERERLEIVGVPTSQATADLARSLGVVLAGLDDVTEIDIDCDGADEVDDRFRMIKGRGGALLREKIVAQSSRQRVILISSDKRVDRLGRHFPVPVEVSPFGIRHTERALRALGAETSHRLKADLAPLVTDEGHRIIDCRFPAILDPEDLDRRLKTISGVVETGLFLGLCDDLIIGHSDWAESIKRSTSQ
jgi:ribose 5-phosphate isomerase A